MGSRTRTVFLALGLLTMLSPLGEACSLCPGQKALTLRQEAAQAKLVLYGTLTGSRLKPNDPLGGGVTEMQLLATLKADPTAAGKKVIELPRYLPVDPKKPPPYVVFCSVFNGKLDPYRGVPVKSPDFVSYLQGAMTRKGPGDGPDLEYYFTYLDSRDSEIALDAFLEFAKASDEQIGKTAGKLNPVKLRQWLKDESTPEDRLGLFAFLLGGCGGEADAAFLRELLMQKPTPRTTNALGGILAGYIQLKPEEGWNLAVRMLGEEKRPLLERHALLGALRFYQGWKAKETKPQVLRALESVLPHGDLADLAIEDLRRWQWWELTPQVLAQFGKKSHDAPIMRRAIVRYALSCSQPEVQKFLAQVRQTDTDLYRDVQESLQFEKRP